MSKALIVYATLSGATKNIADLIQQGVRRTGHDAEVVNANEIKKRMIWQGLDAYVIWLCHLSWSHDATHENLAVSRSENELGRPTRWGVRGFWLER